MAAVVASSAEERPKATLRRPSVEIKVHRLRVVEVSSEAEEQLVVVPVHLVDSAHRLKVQPQVADCLVVVLQHSQLHQHLVARKEALDSSLKAVHQEADFSVMLRRAQQIQARLAEV